MWLRGASVCVKLIRTYLIVLSTLNVFRSESSSIPDEPVSLAVVSNDETLVHDEPSVETSTFPCTV